MKTFMFVIMIALVAIASNLAVAQQGASVEYTATIFATPLLVAGVADAAYENLRPGVCYTTFADIAAIGTIPSNITPYDVTAAELFTPALVNISGGPQAEVAFTFVLPSRLYPSGAGVGHIDMSYDNHSGGWSFGGLGFVSAFFNPSNGLTTTLDGAGLLDIYMGGNPCVSADANDNGGGVVYQNEALLTAEYTGN